MEDFLSKVYGDTEAGAVIVLDTHHAHRVELACQDKHFLVVDTIADILNELRIANKIIIPAYRMKDEDMLYTIIAGYASGQISCVHNNTTVVVNPKYAHSAVVVLVTRDFLNISRHPWLSTVGLSYQPE